jgi:hypothetical protein
MIRRPVALEEVRLIGEASFQCSIKRERICVAEEVEIRVSDKVGEDEAARIIRGVAKCVKLR